MYQFIKFLRSAGKTGALIMASCLLALALQARPIQDISLHIQNETLGSVLLKLEKVSHYSFVYKPELVSGITIGTREFKNKSLWPILDDLLRGNKIDYTVSGTNIILTPAKPPQEKTFGRITGRVVDFENGDPLPGATVRLEGTGTATVTNDQGDYVLDKVPTGKYNILFSYIGYKAGRLNNIEVLKDKTTTASYKLQASGTLNQVEVKGIARRKVVNTTDEQLIDELHGARSVLSGISNEQISRSMDRDAAEIVKRIPGVNVSDDRFIVVRGLNKRYNLTILNDNIAPATELDSRAFSFDLVSSNVIDRIMVYKSPSPDLQGDFAGGLVKIYTKKSMLTKQIDIQISAQYRPGSSFDYMPDYAGSKTDVLGYDNDTRSLPEGMPGPIDFNLQGPAVNAAYGKQFANNYLAINRYNDLDKRVNINYYDSWKIGSRQLNNLTSLSYTFTNEFRETAQTSYYKDNPQYTGILQQGIHGARLSLLQNNNIQLNKHWRVELKNFINQQGNRVAINDYRVSEERTWQDQKKSSLYYRSNRLYSGQLSNYFQWGADNATQLFANIGYSTIQRNDPDLREIGYSRNRDSSYSFTENNPKAQWRNGSRESTYPVSRYFIDVTEQSVQGNLDLEHRFSSLLSVKAGAYHETRQRTLSTRTFRLANGINAYDPTLMIDGDIDEGAGVPAYEWQMPTLLDSANFRYDGTGYRWAETTAPNDQYYAQNENTSGYISGDLHALKNKLNMFGGLRVEYNHFRILGAYQTGQAVYPLVVDQPVTSFLPSINVNYKPDSIIVVRAGYGRTVNRPEFREAAPFSYYDYLNYEIYNGEPNLKTVYISNYDVRFELYPKSMLRNELFNFGVFYKELNRPIELIWARTRQSEGPFNTFYYANTGPAKVLGLEMELRKSLSFIRGNFFRDLSVIVNGAWIKSEVNAPPTIYGGNEVGRKRPLQGQVPYLINASLNYERPASGTRVAISYHRSGDQIYALGTNRQRLNPLDGFPDIMEKGRDLMDFSWSQRVNKHLSLKMGVQNMLNAPVTLYEDYDRNYKYTEQQINTVGGTKVYSGDVIMRRFYTRPYYSIGFNFIF